MVTKCMICANVDCSREKLPCLKCSDNDLYISRFKPHKVFESVANNGFVSLSEVLQPEPTVKEVVKDGGDK